MNLPGLGIQTAFRPPSDGIGRQVDAFDPVVLTIAAGSAMLVAVTASLGPAWRAAQADPATTLGSDE